MTIQKKAVSILGLGMGIMMVVSIVVTSKLFINKMDQLEIQKAKLDIERVNEAINSEVKNLDAKLADWAVWDDSYQFIQDKNKEYIISNLDTSASYESLRLNFMIFVDNNGKLVYEQGYNLDNSLISEVPPVIHRYFDTEKLLKYDSLEDSNAGILSTSEGLYMVAARPILTSNSEGPQKGSIIFGRHFGKAEIDSLASITKQSKITFTVSDEIGKNLISDGSEVKIIDSKNLSGIGLVRDIFDKPIGFFTIDINRDIHLQGIEGVKYLILILGSVSFFFFGFTWYLLGRLVLNPIRKITDSVNDITHSKKFDSRITARGNDEFTHLAEDINSMLSSLESSNQEIFENNKKLEENKNAMLNILEDERQLQNDLKKQKENIETQVAERTGELNSEKSKLTASIEALQKALVMIDLSENIILVNNNLNKVFKENKDTWTLEDIQEKLGKSFDFISAYKNIIKNKDRIEYNKIEFGSRFLQIRLSSVFSEKEKLVTGILAIIGDVTDEVVLERSKDEFFSIASHELRTPLTAIRGNTSMILDYYKDAIKDPEVKTMITDMHDASLRLIGIVNDFLDLSRLEQGRMVYKTAPIKLNDSILDVVKELKATADEKKIKLETILKDTSVVNADADKLKQVLFNLIGNSIKFTTKGGVTISTENKDNMIVVKIIDTGNGIPLANQSLLFRKFQQAGISTITRDGAKGTGLGLYISKLIVEGMGGKIALEKSEEDKGSTFTFTLPVVLLKV